MSTTLSQPPVWFITGCSTGFGRELAAHVLERGNRVVVTARNPRDVESIVRGHEERALVLPLDVTDAGQVAGAVDAALAHFGRIDVLVNNAGGGYLSAVEEGEEEEVRRLFEVNFYGLLRVTNAVLPHLRAQRSGIIVNMSSISGLVAFPSMVFYNATKFAVEALSEGLSKEVAPLGIKVLIVEPSGFRTDWAGRTSRESAAQIADYAETAGAGRKRMRALSGHQPGDPARAARAIVQAVESPQMPLRLLLGKNALAGARAKIEAMQRDFDAWEETTVGADFPDES